MIGTQNSLLLMCLLRGFDRLVPTSTDHFYLPSSQPEITVYNRKLVRKDTCTDTHIYDYNYYIYVYIIGKFSLVSSFEKHTLVVLFSFCGSSTLSQHLAYCLRLFFNSRFSNFRFGSLRNKTNENKNPTMYMFNCITKDGLYSECTTSPHEIHRPEFFVQPYEDCSQGSGSGKATPSQMSSFHKTASLPESNSTNNALILQK